MTRPLMAGDLVAVQRRALSTLVGAQAAGGVAIAAGIAVGALLAEDVSGRTSLAGLAPTATVLGGAAMAVPMAQLAARSGRRPALVAGYAAGAAGAAGVVVAGVLDSFALLLLALALFGGGTAANLQARYAATDAAAPAGRATALSLVVWATTIGAVAGPNLIGVGGALARGVGVPELAGPFLLSLPAFAAAVVLVALRLRPDPLVAAGGTGAPAGARVSTREALRAVAGQPRALAGLVGIAVGHAVMVAVMVMTPVHMRHGGATLTVVGVVVSAHLAGMFCASPIFGVLGDRFGRVRLLALGQALQALALVVISAAGPDAHGAAGVALALLGLGWSASLVAGSTLLTESVPVLVRPAAQGASDLVMGLVAAAAGVLAGPVFEAGGMPVLATGAGLLLLPSVAVLLYGARSQVREARTAH